MIDRFEIIEYGAGRPDASHLIFCDGTGGDQFREDTDLELSHWRPNRTPAEFRAGTSTEICFRFLDHPRPGKWTAAVNNHVDVDGILSIYVLLESDHARAHRQTIVEASEMGDFWGWGAPTAQRVFQGLTQLMHNTHSPHAAYAEAFRRLPGLIDGTDPACSEIDDSLAPLRISIELVDQSHIIRIPIDARLTHYIVPQSLAGSDAQATYVPEFNEAISPQMILWPHVRARWDAERASLVSTERPDGWFHDLWFPGYLWADTEGKWQPHGLTYHEGMSRYQIESASLIAAINTLQHHETTGQWGMGGTELPYGDELQKQFPLVARVFNRQGQPSISRLSPEQVAKALEGAL